MLRTLLVDDSRIFRTGLAKLLSGHPSVSVVASEFSAERGLARIGEGGIDLVLLDMTMPKVSGVGFLQRMRTMAEKPMVILMSGAYDGSAPEVLEAVSLGASGFVSKSSGTDIVAALDEELNRVALHRSPRREAPKRAEQPAPPPPPAHLALGEMVGIVSSTGGPAALQVLLSGLSPRFELPIVIVQHLPPGFAKSMALNLSRRAGREVHLAEDGTPLRPGVVLIAPGEKHLEVVRRGPTLVCRLIDGAKENGCRPAGDRMIRTAAGATRGAMTGICLTGMGRDGAAGMRELAERGGQIIVQDEASSIVWGMPAAVLDAGVQAIVLPLQRISGSLNRKANRAA